MARLLRCEEYRPLNPILGIPAQISIELMNALGEHNVIMAAISYASKWLAQSLRKGNDYTVYECKDVQIIATLEQDESGWYVQIDPCEPDSHKQKESVCKEPVCRPGR